MWTCQECGKTFKNTNQSHYCVQKPQTIEEYILNQREEIQAYLIQVHKTIKAVLPDVTEKISWSMPTYWKGKNIIHFAAHKNHLGLYPGPEGVEHFADKLSDYSRTKGAIQFPYNKPIPLDLIAEIAKWCYEEYAK
ncbi:MAG: DUF1801 domain-containing protein [Bacillota bacterium]|nr:DUF1801 domain-containing protein [Bacillota bacterium]